MELLTLILLVVNSCLLLGIILTKFLELSKKAKKHPTDEAAEFLLDIRRHGYSFIRLSPDDVQYRSPKR